jgi:phosphate transport system substrate-binding protein
MTWKPTRRILFYMKKVRSIAPGLLISTLVVVLTTGCGSQGTSSGGPSEVIAIDGSSTVFPITEAVAEEFQLSNPGARVTVGVSGTGGGFAKFCRGEIDLSDASRIIKESEIELCATNGIDFIELPIAYDGIAVVVHVGNDWVDTITVEELKRIWEPEAEGKILRWSEVRTGWPDRELHLFGPGADSGTFDYFTEAIVGQEDASRGDFTSSEDDNVLVQGVTSDELALGFFGYAYYEANLDRLKVVPIDDEDESNGKGAIAASPEAVQDGTYQPLSRPIFIYVSLSALERSEVGAFVDFYLTQAAPLVREVGYIPLSELEYDLVKTRKDSGMTGTMFGSGSFESKTSLEDVLRGSTGGTQ